MESGSWKRECECDEPGREEEAAWAERTKKSDCRGGGGGGAGGGFPGAVCRWGSVSSGIGSEVSIVFVSCGGGGSGGCGDATAADGGGAVSGGALSRMVKRCRRLRSKRSRAGRNSFGKRTCSVNSRFFVSGDMFCRTLCDNG